MIRIAKIINTRGLRGECKLYLHTDEDELRFSRGQVLYLDEKTPLTVESYSRYKGFGYVKFKGIDTIEKAEEFKNHTLYLPAEELPELEDNEFYYHQLAGCEVYNEKGEDTGKVTDILETGANLVLRVKGEKGEYLLPFVEAFIDEVLVDEKKIIIKEMEGLR